MYIILFNGNNINIKQFGGRKNEKRQVSILYHEGV